MAFVLDASMTLKWLFEDEATEFADALFRQAATDTLHVPLHWAVEVGNAAVKGERRRRATPADTAAFLARLADLDIVVDGNGGAFTQLVPLARAWQLSVYDAGYLELAQRLGLPIAAHDKALRDAAFATGVVLLPALLPGEVR